MRSFPILCCAAMLAMPLEAQSSAPKPGLAWGLALMTGYGLGDLNQDLHSRAGYGLHFDYQIPVSGHIALRPGFEWMGYRMSVHNDAAAKVSEAYGTNYQDTRTLFRTYRAAVDGLFYFSERQDGFFVSLGVGAQRSDTQLQDIARDANAERFPLLDVRARRSGLWVGAGVGYQMEFGNVEVRASRAPYAFTSDRVMSAQPVEPVFKARQGWSVNLLLGVRTLFER
jgi:hypothetical protein